MFTGGVKRGGWHLEVLVSHLTFFVATGHIFGGWGVWLASLFHCVFLLSSEEVLMWLHLVAFTLDTS
jgi:hypothetical protein